MDAVIYARVSLDPRDTGRSVSEQETECRRVADREGWTVRDVFVDNDRSASRYATKERPGFLRLVQYLTDHDIDVLLAWESSRLTRDLSTFVQLRDLCRDRGIRWSHGGRLLDLNDDSDQYMAVIDAAGNERASAETSKRVRRSVRANAAAGRPHGRLTYGYRREYDPTTRTYLGQNEDPDQADILREVARRFLAGESFYALARELEARGVAAPTGAHWYPTNLRRLMSNPAYHGERVHQGVIVGAAAWPPIFDDATWWSMQARLADPVRLTRRDGAVKHLLTGIAACGVCDLPVRLGNNRGRSSYHCPSFHVARVESEVDDVVVGVLLARLAQADAVDLLTSSGETNAVETLVKTAQEKRARLETFYDSAARGEITPAALARIESSLLAEIKTAEANTRRIASSTVLGSVAGIDADRWSSLAMGTRREIVRLLVDVRVLAVGRGKRVFDPASISIEWKHHD